MNNGGASALVILRALMGFVEGPTFPALSVLLAQWIPENERSKAGAIVYSGASLGAIFAMTVSGLILKFSDGEWPLIFYFFGTMGVVSYLLNTAFCYSKPNQNPFISEDEMMYLKRKLSKYFSYKSIFDKIINSNFL